MAGTGNLEVLRLCRYLRARVGPMYGCYVLYGSHMAVSMSLGLLFLGGGRYVTLSLVRGPVLTTQSKLFYNGLWGGAQGDTSRWVNLCVETRRRLDDFLMGAVVKRKNALVQQRATANGVPWRLKIGICSWLFRYTLSTKPEAVAAMLCAFFPKFPIHGNDNR